MLEMLDKPLTGPKLDWKHGCITMSHGSGGRAMAQLIEQLFVKAFSNPWLNAGNDQAIFDAPCGKQMVMTTDSYVISPLFFPGGNIGSLAVYGTINDLAMGGATPLYLSVGFILEEGFALSDLKTIVYTMSDAAKACNVTILTGDTKVVERGKGDGIFINTTGFGVIAQDSCLSGEYARPGDKVLVSGYIGDHGIAILSQRESLQFSTNVTSDCAPLHSLVAKMLEVVPQIRCLRDPTRGGLATTLNEWARQSEVGFMIDEATIPVRTAVASACEILGLDPLYVANEGKLVAVCPTEQADLLLATMQAHPLGEKSAIIGSVTKDLHQMVQLRTKIGGYRNLDWLTGEQLPRIC